MSTFTWVQLSEEGGDTWRQVSFEHGEIGGHLYIPCRKRSRGLKPPEPLTEGDPDLESGKPIFYFSPSARKAFVTVMVTIRDRHMQTDIPTLAKLSSTVEK